MPVVPLTMPQGQENGGANTLHSNSLHSNSLHSKGRRYERDIVGQRVSVYWEDEATWFEGKVVDYNPVEDAHYVRYDDGDQRDEPFNSDALTWELLPDIRAAPKNSTNAQPRRRKQDAQPKAKKALAGDEVSAPPRNPSSDSPASVSP